MGGYNKQYVKEIQIDADTLFAAIDKDNSGTISKNELREHLKEVEIPPAFARVARLHKPPYPTTFLNNHAAT